MLWKLGTHSLTRDRTVEEVECGLRAVKVDIGWLAGVGAREVVKCGGLWLQGCWCAREREKWATGGSDVELGRCFIGNLKVGMSSVGFGSGRSGLDSKGLDWMGFRIGSEGLMVLMQCGACLDP